MVIFHLLYLLLFFWLILQFCYQVSLFYVSIYFCTKLHRDIWTLAIQLGMDPRLGMDSRKTMLPAGYNGCFKKHIYAYIYHKEP